VGTTAALACIIREEWNNYEILAGATHKCDEQ
jgi:hypothetical protein